MASIIAPERLSELIGLIYDAAIDPRRWRVALEEIRSELSCANSALGLHAIPSGDVLLNITTNIPQDYVDRMVGYGADVVDLWGGVEAMTGLPWHEPSVLSRRRPEAVDFEATTNRYALEWARPQGLIDVMAIGLAKDERTFGSLAFGRHESAGPIRDRDVAVALLLVPHLQRAAAINSLLDLAALARDPFQEVFDLLAAPILLVSADLRLVHANPAALPMLQAHDPLAVRDGFIRAASGIAEALASAVTQGARDESAMGRKGFGIPARRRDGSIAALHVLPLSRQRLPARGAAAAAIFLSPSSGAATPAADLLEALFGLTPTEARVLSMLVAGQTPSKTAAVLGVKLATVRTHIARIYAKIGVSRLSDLLQIANSLAAPVAERG